MICKYNVKTYDNFLVGVVNHRNQDVDQEDGRDDHVSSEVYLAKVLASCVSRLDVIRHDKPEQRPEHGYEGPRKTETGGG